jgi:nucleoside-diphosphate-sugar epimerase
VTGGRILVTGASGFVGCRVAENLVLAHGVEVRGTYHRASRAARVARLGIELVPLDLASEQSIAAAVTGCDAVVHCAYGYGRDLTGAAAGRIADASLRAGVGRFVHLSSAAVWGFDAGPGEIDEATNVRRTGHPYVDGKIESEEAVAAVAARGLAAVVLRPTNIYGPWSAIWTEAPAGALRAAAPAIVGDGETPANTVYIDNVVSAIVLALNDDRLIGGTYVVTDEDGLTWRSLYENYAAAVTPPLEVRSISPEEWRNATKRPRFAAVRELRGLLRSPEAAALVRAAAARPALRRLGARVVRVLPGGLDRAKRTTLAPPLAQAGAGSPPLPSPELVSVQTSGAVYRATGLRALGWEPVVPPERALEITRAWLRWARLL